MSILETVEHVIGSISNTVWPIFLPLVMIVGLFLIIRTFTVIQPQTTKPAKVDAAHIVGPAVISLGAMIGTGAIIGVLGEDQKLTAYEALKAVTINGAYQIFEEDSKGSITAGKLADLVVLDSNPLTVDGDKIKDIVVLETIKEGKTIYSA